MSQNKTIIPGMRNINNIQSQENEMPADFYRRPQKNGPMDRPAEKKTIIGEPDPTGKTNPIKMEKKEEEPQPDKTPKIIMQDRPIVGVLFSVSRKTFGEIFPVYLGRNVIGRDSSCDIILNETTVSERHGVLVVKFNPAIKKHVSSITDTNSSCGTALNGEQIYYDTHVLENNDHILVGTAYELVYIRLDADTLNLKPCPFFKEAQPMQPAEDFNPYAPSGGRKKAGGTHISYLNYNE